MDNLNYKNLYSYCNYSINTKNPLFYIDILNKRDITPLSVSQNKIDIYSCEHLHLLSKYYRNNKKKIVYLNIINIVKDKILNQSNNFYFINVNVVSFITPFSKGTTHGFTGFFELLINYLNLKNNTSKFYKNLLPDEFENLKILIYKNTNQGMLDILYCLSDKNILDKSNFIFIDDSKLYKFKSLTYLPYKSHNYLFETDLKLKINNLIKNYLLDNIRFKNNYDDVCIIKSNNDELNLTNNDNGFNDKEIRNYVENKNLTLIDPFNLSELELINILYSCKTFTVSWGSAFHKNIVYLSKKCHKINVIVKKGTIYEDQVKKYSAVNNINNIDGFEISYSFLDKLN